MSQEVRSTAAVTSCARTTRSARPLAKTSSAIGLDDDGDGDDLGDDIMMVMMIVMIMATIITMIILNVIMIIVIITMIILNITIMITRTAANVNRAMVHVK